MRALNISRRTFGTLLGGTALLGISPLALAQEFPIKGKPIRILVPFPHAVDDHQTHNAGFLVAAGAALLIQQRELSPRRLADLLLSLTRDRLLEMANRARALAKPGATTAVADVCMAAAG
jgi:UDP-N-acetylglucosamine:LPS N-acetylglucosamine transferase